MMISRRSLVGGISALPFAVSLTACAARATGAAAAPEGAAAGPTGPVGPGASWNGAALSGGRPPADPTRTTAKPAVHWLIPSDLRLVTNLAIGVDADADGGVKQVDFWVEGAIYTVTTPTIFKDVDANGQARSRYGFWIALDAAKFRAISATGAARIFATAIPNDPTMQSRVIGITSGDALTDNLRGDYAMTVFPRPVANDWSKTVARSGGDYTSIAAAIAAATSAAAEAPLITIVQTGFYELENASSRNNHSNGVGFCTVRAAPGVTAMLGRSAPFIPNDPASWAWIPGWDGMEFRGSGIVFDQRNWSTISFTAKPAWFNGCKFTNSIGTRDTLYWNNGPPPSFGPGQSHGLYSYWDNVSAAYVSGGFQIARYVQGCQVQSTFGDIFSGCHYISGNYVRDWTSNFFLLEVKSLDVSFQPQTQRTSATITKTGGTSPGGTVTLKVDGATVLSINLGYYAGDNNQTIDQLATTINSLGGGWKATVTGDASRNAGTAGQFRSATLGGDGGHANPNEADVLYKTVSLISSYGIHGDWWQGYSGGSTRENVIIRNNITRDSIGNNAFINNDADRANDYIIKGNIWLGVRGDTVIGGAGASYFGGAVSGSGSSSHYVFENNILDAQVVRREYFAGNPKNPVQAQDLKYSKFRHNIVGQVSPFGYSGSGSNYPFTPPWNDNLYIGTSYPMNGPADSGNVNYKGANIASLFRAYSDGDLRPAPNGVLMSNLKPRINRFDGQLGLFAENDVVGAWSKDRAPKADYPF